MKIATVTPINKGIFKENLTYFTTLEIKEGSIVQVPIGNRKIQALVIKIEELTDMKSEIKNSDFALKKISQITHENFFRPEFIEACRETADYFASNLGQIIKSLSPKSILENEALDLKRPLSEDPAKPVLAEGEAPTIKQYKFVLQQADEERLTYYKGLIRETFAKKNSVFLCLPTASDIDRIAESFEKGIGEFTTILHSNLSKKEILTRWSFAVENQHPVLIIATPIFLSIPRHDLGLIIFEKENTSSYKDLSRPFIDYRTFGEIYATKLKAKIIFGDLALRSETIFRTERGDFAPIPPMKYRSLANGHQMVIDAKNDNRTGLNDARAISKELAEIIQESFDNKEKIFIMCGRKGISPMTVCNDCGQMVFCDNCGAPLSLHKNHPAGEKSNKTYIYLCHKCGNIKDVRDKCSSCGSWRLSLLGQGVEKVEEEIKALLPECNIFKITSEDTKSYKKAKEVFAKFQTQPKSILIGTEMANYFITEKIDNIVMTGIDGFFSIPDFRISEKVLVLILRLRQLANKKFIIQTRKPEEKVLDYGLKGNLLDFYRDEIDERRKFGYPPFKVLIKITRVGKKFDVLADMKSLETSLANYSPVTFPAAGQPGRGEYMMHTLIKLTSAKWVDQELLEKLKALPPAFLINIEPESIL